MKAVPKRPTPPEAVVVLELVDEDGGGVRVSQLVEEECSFVCEVRRMDVYGMIHWADASHVPGAMHVITARLADALVTAREEYDELGIMLEANS